MVGQWLVAGREDGATKVSVEMMEGLDPAEAKKGLEGRMKGKRGPPEIVI